MLGAGENENQTWARRDLGGHLGRPPAQRQDSAVSKASQPAAQLFSS